VKALLSSLRLAIHGLWRAKGRSALTSLGILIGIAAVVIVTALGTGAREAIDRQIESLGSNIVFIFHQESGKSGARQRAGAGSGLTERDALAIRREATAIDKVTVYSEVRAQVVSELGNDKIAVIGVDNDYFPVRGYSVASGRSFTDADQQLKAKICLIGQTAIEKLFGSVDPVGRYVRIGKYPYLVIGTLTPKGQSPFEDQDDRVLMPIGSFRARVLPTLGDRVQLVMATTRGAARTDEAVRQIDAILRQRHGIEEGDEPDFRVRTQEEFRKSQDAIFGIVTALLLSVAAIALFVGGVGVMNIMLVGVTERTREIGIRMAIGARRADIRTQFLIESVALTLIGGLAGILAAIGGIALLESTLGWSMRLSIEAVLVALGTSVAIGLVFGLWPALRAAQLDPIEALRHE
jgi:putative ABC transport system permease protein